MFRLTYCGNVHAAADLDAWLAGLQQHSAAVAAVARARGRQFGLGAWWPANVAAQLAGDRALQARVRDRLAALALPLWTLNVFPHGDFHQEVVKTAVYEPDWGEEDRLHYTLHCAEAGAALCNQGDVLPLSTLPLGHRAPGEETDLRLMARNLARCASALADLEARTGVCCVLALEPEPDCLLETCAGAAQFLEQWLFEEGAWPTVAERELRRHLGVCVDLCHLAVVGEEPLAAIADLQARGIAVPKIQLSSCLELRDAAALDRLLAFAEPRYLHQTAGRTRRALDLGLVARRRAEFAADVPLRTHFHLPLYWDDPGPLGSTRREVERVLRALAGRTDLPLLEVETYTWGVLPGAMRGAPLPELIARELDFAAALLAPPR